MPFFLLSLFFRFLVKTSKDLADVAACVFFFSFRHLVPGGLSFLIYFDVHGPKALFIPFSGVSWRIFLAFFVPCLSWMWPAESYLILGHRDICALHFLSTSVGFLPQDRVLPAPISVFLRSGF